MSEMSVGAVILTIMTGALIAMQDLMYSVGVRICCNYLLLGCPLGDL